MGTCVQVCLCWGGMPVQSDKWKGVHVNKKSEPEQEMYFIPLHVAEVSRQKS